MGIQQIKAGKGIPYPFGATVMGDTINFAAALHSQEECGVILYDAEKKESCKIPFQKEHRIGNICCMSVKAEDCAELTYNFYIGETIVTDPYARRLIGRENWGQRPQEDPPVRAAVMTGEFDWGDDAALQIPYEDSVFYCLHVRGFTKGRHSGVANKGTFAGVIEKIPYLKELGVRNIELMPVYEFSELFEQEEEASMQYAMQHYMDAPESAGKKTRLNYWGYCDAFYFAPKASYAASKDPVTEFKTLVRALHQNGMEVICQFYFPDSCKQGYILEVLKYWVLAYHIDGIHLIGRNIPVTLLATEPLLSNTKLIYDRFPTEQIYQENTVPEYRNLALATDGYMTDVRRFLKSDEDLLPKMIRHFTENRANCARLCYITNYYGFTLYDLVSYDRKHNEDNGENNQDGNDYNFSWNCGAEGASRKASVNRLRAKQMRNALTMLVISQGAPFFFAGDEDCNTQKGNNNPYCQDNEIGWKDWNQSAFAAKQTEFLRKLLAFRAAHPVLRKKGECSLADEASCGFPELSFHSDEAYRVKTDNYNRHMGMMYAGVYGDQKGAVDADIYIAYNMHWINHRFALPNLPKGQCWRIAIDTSEEEGFEENGRVKEGYTVVQGRSIQVLVSCKE